MVFGNGSKGLSAIARAVLTGAKQCALRRHLPKLLSHGRGRQIRSLLLRIASMSEHLPCTPKPGGRKLYGKNTALYGVDVQRCVVLLTCASEVLF